MRIVYSQKHLQHQPLFEYLKGQKTAHFEKKERIEAIKNELEKYPQFSFVSSKEYEDSYIEQVHNLSYLAFLKQNKTTGIIFNEFCEDTFTFFSENTFASAKNAVDCALTGAELLLHGEKNVYCLTRPPGHHARFAVAGGYCYLNNGVIAAHYLQQHFENKRIAFLDIDIHHGNGTEELMKDDPNVLSISIHLSTKEAYPYSGGNTSHGSQINITVEKNICEADYVKLVEQSVKKINDFQPAFVITLFGYDTFMEDPIAGINLTIESYNKIGRAIAALNSPLLILQEGGYVIDKAGEIVCSFLQGVELNESH